MRWITTLDEACGASGACAWSVRLDDEAAQRAAATPTPADLAHAARARAADGGAARLWRRRLLRALAASRLGVHPDAVVFADGEPAPPAQLLAPAPLYVSGASRGCWTVVAVGPGPLGVDVELMGADIAALGGSPAEALRKWTAAEAYVKATGCALDLAWDLAGSGPRLQAQGLPACDISHQPVGPDAYAAAAEAWLRR